MTKKVLLFEPDLLFSSRIESAASKAGWQVRVAVTLDELQGALRESVPTVLLVDLDALASSVASSLGPVAAPCKRIGYYSHSDSKLAARALADGFEVVIPRRTFMNQLNKIFTEAESG